MEKELISIGKMAEMSRLTVATLRLYDELGLLVPKHKEPETGYRYYNIMTEFNVFDDSRRSMFLRLQVPVNFAR